MEDDKVKSFCCIESNIPQTEPKLQMIQFIRYGIMLIIRTSRINYGIVHWYYVVKYTKESNASELWATPQYAIDKTECFPDIQTVTWLSMTACD